MIIETDNMPAPSWERAGRLYEKNIELDNRRRKSAQARIPSDPNVWQQMRENYEAIILEDHTFSEKHNIEHALWQLHYKKIEELRAHYSAAQASANSNASVNGKGPSSRPDRITKIRLHFKTFLSEATGFYHDLILKIRSKYGLPLGYFSEEVDSRLLSEKDGKKSADVKRVLISCHRCLIYLGDLARYKGLYGEPDSKSREYAAASSYYLQAASLWPSIGNPHHQLAILASYSGDDLLTVYRYFRSLAVDNPCSTARDNLIVAFEKNRQSFSLLHGDAKSSIIRSAGKVRGQKAKLASKDTVAEAATFKESNSNTHDTYNSLCIHFVRLNGILFTRTSLETFAEVLSLVVTGLRDLMSSGPEEEMSFGNDAVENGLFFVRLVSIFIYTIHNVKRESEGQSYAEIVQRAVLLQNALTAVFEIMGLVMERCEQVRDPSLSYLLPGILVFVEWLASYPDVAMGGDVDEKQATVRSNLWSRYVSLMNKLLSIGSMSIDDCDDESCFDNMSRYEEGETGNRLALCEDFELRGFLPLVPAQTILDFSRKHSFGSEGIKEKNARVKRTLAAGKVLVGGVKINNETVWYDSKAKKFVIGVESQLSAEDIRLPDSTVPKANDMLLENGAQTAVKSEEFLSNSQLYVEGEEEDEEIVFKPTAAEKQTDTAVQNLVSSKMLEPQKNVFGSGQPFSVASMSAPPDNSLHMTTSDAFSWNPISTGNLQPVKSHTLNWLTEETLLSNSFKDLRMLENGHLAHSEINENTVNFFPAVNSFPNRQSAIKSDSLFLNQANAPDAVVPSSIYNSLMSSGVSVDALAPKPSSPSPVGLKKKPVARPLRHIGPPPGFNAVPKQANGPFSGLDLSYQNQMLDNYSWLDGYQMSSAFGGIGDNSISYSSFANLPPISSSAASIGTVSFPFPGKQVPSVHQMEIHKGWHDHETVECPKQMQQPQQIINGNPQLGPLPEQYQGPVWTGHHFV
ncbi:nonsense-mediated mRNA decay factor SMG7-like [Syzygium oleosum]|uniref:nonsense-mediated mRNA decay factor SMG7-like n=1 Tax=Syzygium oleosum TaxID=219896 RepID=UPI0024B8E415|nr:nonsense-mediated mRNA decay factor SMG7-like [Syzygium oleosum]XP_056162190.1 nonsense-mediated mRNA decay factor SMG7-like [Syzygium oleosum]